MIIVIILIIVPYFAFRGEGRERVFVVCFPSFFCVCVAYTTLPDAVTNSAP